MKRRLFATALGVVLLACGALLIGSVELGPVRVLEGLTALWTDREGLAATIVTSVRLPRVLGALLVGAALGAAGVAMQAFFKNPLADPWIVGVAPGGSLGAIIAITAGWTWSFFGVTPVSVMAFVGATVLAVLTFLLARSPGGGIESASLLLLGIALGSFASAFGTWLLITSDAEFTSRALVWLTGSLASVRWTTLAAGVWPFALGGILLFLLAPKFDYLLVPEEEAGSMGVNVTVLRWLTLAAATLLTAASVAVAGVVAFVGLIVPHAVRLIVGGAHRKLTPYAVLAGAGFMVVVDTLARSLTATEIPLSLVTAFLGVPFFVYLLRRKGAMTW